MIALWRIGTKDRTFLCVFTCAVVRVDGVAFVFVTSCTTVVVAARALGCIILFLYYKFNVNIYISRYVPPNMAISAC